VFLVAPGVPYRAHIEVVQADMRSDGEYVEIWLGGAMTKCNPMPTSDFDCTLAPCAVVPRVLGATGDEPSGAAELRVLAVSSRTRDTCKCAVAPPGQPAMVDCYSALVSGLDPTYGMFVQLRLVPDVVLGWEVGAWSRCASWQCVGSGPAARSGRSVRCVASASADNADNIAVLPTPREHVCLESASPPESERPCKDVLECAAPALCDRCFSLRRWDNLSQHHGASWSAVWSDASTQVELFGAPLELQLVRGLANVSGVSVARCHAQNHIVIRGDSGAGPPEVLELAENDGTHGFHKRATFFLRRVSAMAFSLIDDVGAAVTAENETLLRMRPIGDTLGPDAAAFVAIPTIGDNQPCTPSDVPDHLPRHACRFATGWCCHGHAGADGALEGCRLFDYAAGVTREAAVCSQQSCNRVGLMLIEQGRCEVMGCTPISDASECEAAAKTFGFGASLGKLLRAELLVTSQRPSHCTWEPGSLDTEEALWFNVLSTAVEATSEHRQLCDCSAPELRSYSWSVGPWGRCSFDCGRQRRSRNVTCVATVSRQGLETTAAEINSPSEQCLSAGLPEPPHIEPCVTKACFKSLRRTRCAGEERPISEQEAYAFGTKRLVSAGWGGSHCVEVFVSDPEVSVDICRHGCMHLEDCVGLTFYVAVESSSRSAHRCCFLREARRWEGNFRYATCHLLQGVQTRTGCHCQVGWTQQVVSGEARTNCGMAHGGCCTTTESGAVAWCPTTSPSCGARFRGKKRWDLCDPQGMATVTEGTCQTHRHKGDQYCATTTSAPRCNQIATALRLPDTTPTSTLATHMPSGCVWQRSTSQLWLNELPTSANSTKSSEQGARPASQDFPQLCDCQSQRFHWEVGPWGKCFEVDSASGTCNVARNHVRSVWCVREGVQGVDGSGEIVDDTFCAAPRPVFHESCGGCSEEVVAAEATFGVPPSFEWNDFLHTCETELARAMGVEAARVRFGFATRGDHDKPVRVELLVAGSSAVSSGDALERLMVISRSAQRRSTFRWSARFLRFALSLSVRVLGVYSWRAGGVWGPCSARCGGGVQARVVQCVFQHHKSLQPVVAQKDRCAPTTKPASARTCSVQPCLECPGLHLGPAYTTSADWSAEGAPHGSEVYVTCANGYGTVDDVVLGKSRCANGEWTSLELSCGLDCQPLELDPWRYSFEVGGLKHGDIWQVTCSNRSSMAVESPPSGTAVCNNGRWAQPMLVCTGDCQEIVLSGAYVVRDVRDGINHDGGYAPHGTRRHVACALGFGSSAGALEVTMQCVDGVWQGRDQLPECKADCPMYGLPEGYELQSGSSRRLYERRLPEPFVGADPSDGSTGSGSVPHGSVLSIQCADRESRVPFAVETVHCTDGQWSTLSLDCGKDCAPINKSSPEYRRYKIDMGVEAYMGPQQQAIRAGGQSVTPRIYRHGSIVKIGCRGSYGPGNSVAAAGAGIENELRCENGNWTPPRLRCFDDCSAFAAGRQYSVLLPGTDNKPVATLVPHGTKVFATCAAGFSIADGGGRIDGSVVSADSVAVVGGGIAYFDHVTCKDGAWTLLKLRCVPHCPLLQLGPQLEVRDLGGGWKVDARREVACVSSLPGSALVHLRCSETGVWHVVENITEAESREERRSPRSAAPQVQAAKFTVEHNCSCVSFRLRTMRDGVLAWSDSGHAYSDVPEELEGATFFAGPMKAMPTGLLTASSSVEAAVYVFASSAPINGMPGWDPVFAGVFRWGQTRSQRMFLWRMRLKPGSVSSVEIPVGPDFVGGVALKRFSKEAVLRPYRMINTVGQLCPPHQLIDTTEDCAEAARALGIGLKGAKVFGLDTEGVDLDKPWVTPARESQQSLPGCYVRTDARHVRVELAFNPDLASRKAVEDKEWLICKAGQTDTREIPLDLNEPFPLYCQVPTPTVWETLADDEKALIVILSLGVIFSLCGVAFNTWQVWVNRCSFSQKSKYALPMLQSSENLSLTPTMATRVEQPRPGSALASGLPIQSRWLSARSALSFDGVRQFIQLLPSFGSWQRRHVDAATVPHCLRCPPAPASHICFPCGHLCLCVVCAEEVSLRFIGGETDLFCPSCQGRIDCVIDGKPSGAFKVAGRERYSWPIPSVWGRPVGRRV